MLGMCKRSVVVLLLGSTMMFSAQAAPKITKVKDWEVMCDKDKQGIQRCAMRQPIKSDDGKVVAKVIVINSPKHETKVAIISVPQGVLLPAGMGIQVDNADPKAYPYYTCIPQEGCQVHLPLKPEILNPFKRGNKAYVMVVDIFGKRAKAPFSLRGFSKAFAQVR